MVAKSQQPTSTLSGFVRDGSDGESLPSASVAVAVEGHPLMGTMSNSEGYYAIQGIPAGTCAVTVSYIGYSVDRDTLSLASGQELRRDVELDRESVHVGGVVVRAEASSENELRHQPSVVNLKMKSLRQMPAMGEPDLLRSLQLLPGVQTASDFSSGLYVRGGSPDQTGIHLDQIRLYNPSHAFGIFSTFNPDAIKDVTFYKGVYPAQYGGNLGAVLDVQNRDGNRRDFSTSGGISLISSRLMMEGPLGNGSWMVAGRRTYIDPVLRLIRAAVDDLDGLGYRFYDVNAKVNTQMSANDNLMISAYGGDDHLDIALADSTNTFAFGNRWGNRALTGRWTHVFSPALFGRMIALYCGRSFPPKYDRRHDVSLTMTYRLSKWSWNTNFVYGTGQAYTPASARYTLREPASDIPIDRYLAARRNTARLLPYHRLDVGVRRRLRPFGAEAEFYLQIFNVYNRRNEWFIQYDPDNTGKKPAVAKMLPIMPTFGFDFKF